MGSKLQANLERNESQSPAFQPLRLLIHVRDLVRVLWACRVSITSLVLGVALFWLAAPARDLFMDQRTTTLSNVAFWSLFGLALTFGWAMPVHYSARRVLDSDRWIRIHEAIDEAETARLRVRAARPILWVPRVLGTLCFVAVVVGMITATDELPSIDVDEVVSARTQLWVLAAATIASGVVFTWLTITRRQVFALVPTTVGTGYLAVASVPLVVIALFPSLAQYVPRAPLLMLMLGAWVPPVTALVLLSHRLRMPIIAAAASVAAVVSVLIGDDHDISRLELTSKQLAIADAVSEWRIANDCLPAPKPCDAAPIVVLGAGGAIRAAFYTASTLGALLDATCPSDGESCGGRPAIVSRIFAISSVSGSALAAVTLAAALRRSGKGGEPPCFQQDPAGLWMGFDKPKGWRQCLQQLVTGDYLSPVAIAALFRDINPLFKPWDDRARILEQSFEHRFGSVLAIPDLVASSAQLSNEEVTLASAFSSFLPTAERWSPLLIMNGTSVATGRRILTSHIDIAVGAEERLFLDAYDLDEFQERGRKAPDVSLTTAVTNSARFPIVSPHGAIRVDADIRDRVVDGGYFENFGALTGIELVDALKDSGLNPLVLVITNEPEHDVPLCVIEREVALAIPNAGDHLWLSWLGAPLEAMMSTRSARGTHALAQLRRLTAIRPRQATNAEIANQIRRAPGQQLSRFAYVRVIGDAGPRGELRQLSASWWASKAVQAILDRSLRSAENIAQLRSVCAALGKAASRCIDRLDALRLPGVKAETGAAGRANFSPNGVDLETDPRCEPPGGRLAAP